MNCGPSSICWVSLSVLLTGMSLAGCRSAPAGALSHTGGASGSGGVQSSTGGASATGGTAGGTDGPNTGGGSAGGSTFGTGGGSASGDTGSGGNSGSSGTSDADTDHQDAGVDQQIDPFCVASPFSGCAGMVVSCPISAESGCNLLADGGIGAYKCAPTLASALADTGNCAALIGDGVTTCGDYAIRLLSFGDVGTTAVYDVHSGALIAVLDWSLSVKQSGCLGGPAEFTIPDCADPREIPRSCPEAGAGDGD